MLGSKTVSEDRMFVSEMLPKHEHLLAKRQADFFLDSLGEQASKAV